MSGAQALTFWRSVLPESWPEAPTEMTVSTLVDIEACPRRWALGRATYSGLWSKRGYPRRLHLAAVAGSVIHLALEIVTRELVRAGCTSVMDAGAPQVMRQLGGYSALLTECIDRVLSPFADNPRARHQIETATRTLRAQLPDLRARAQALLGRVRLEKGQAKRAVVGVREKSSRTPLRNGTWPELELRATPIAWKGIADLLVLSDDLCEIVDFKTGEPNDKHQFQVRVYALLWNRDGELNPTRRLATALTLAYPDNEVSISAPSERELDVLETEIVRRRDVALEAVKADLPEARPAPELCNYCDVRQLCDAYWDSIPEAEMSETQKATQFGDFELTIIGRHGPLSWDAVVKSAGRIESGRRVLLRTSRSDLELAIGKTVRILDAFFLPFEEDLSDPVIVTMGVVTEIFDVEA